MWNEIEYKTEIFKSYKTADKSERNATKWQNVGCVSVHQSVHSLHARHFRCAYAIC